MIAKAGGDLRLGTEARTARLGAAIGAVLRLGEAVCLDGPLGAGKSVLARGLIRAVAPEEPDIPSPTFTLAQAYPGRLLLIHFDLWRIKSAEEAFEIGLDDALAHGAAVIEWAERLGRHRPPDRLDVELAIEGEARRARLTPHGAWEGRPLDL